ncbi:MAG: hypothetical protein H0X27_07455 [Caulobacteraceae bacterium]|nr:hypothetical protein [Caulobacteraceae bacterium]
MRRISRGLALGAGLALAIALPAGAAWGAAAPTRAAVVQAVIDCRKIEDGPGRLACYDKAVDGMAQAEAKGDLVTVDREQRRAVRRQAFGFNLPSLSLFDRGEKSGEADKISAKVAAASRDPYGKWVIKLDDGAVWRQTDANYLDRDAHKGSTVEIRKGALGSFLMKVDGQQAIKVRRES